MSTSPLTNEQIDALAEHIASGGNPVAWGRKHERSYVEITEALNDPKHQLTFSRAWDVARQRGIQQVLGQLRDIAEADPAEIFDEHGCVRPIDEIPEATRKAIDGIEVKELWGKVDGETEKVGEVKKVKLTPRLKALEMLAKQLGLLVDTTKIEAGSSLEELIQQSIRMEKEGGRHAPLTGSTDVLRGTKN